MLNPLSFFSKFIKSNNQRELDRIGKIVEKVNFFENDLKNLADTEFPIKTQELKDKIKKGISSNEILPEAFALVREASARTRNERHYDVQIIGGVVLHENKITMEQKNENFCDAYAWRSLCRNLRFAANNELTK